MREIEQAAISEGQVTGLELMERAGRGVVEAIFARWPALAERPSRALVLAGPGNNGGDGFVIARLLSERGWTVEARLWGEAGKMPDDARSNYDRARGRVEVLAFGTGPVLKEEALVVDALFGIGQKRALPPEVADFAAHLAVMQGVGGLRVVSVDVPSGIDSDTGAALGPFEVFADLTVTFHARKPCHFDAEALKRCGEVVVKGIGL